MPTTSRNMRIPDDLWDAVKARASEEHTTATAFVIAAVLRALRRR